MLKDIDKISRIDFDDDWKKEYIRLVAEGYIHSDCKPIKCIKCDCYDFKPQMASEIDEYITCTNCNNLVGHCAMGYWQPVF